jgi:hypothetical protein
MQDRRDRDRDPSRRQPDPERAQREGTSAKQSRAAGPRALPIDHATCSDRRNPKTEGKELRWRRECDQDHRPNATAEREQRTPADAARSETGKRLHGVRLVAARSQLQF